MTYIRVLCCVLRRALYKCQNLHLQCAYHVLHIQSLTLEHNSRSSIPPKKNTRRKSATFCLFVFQSWFSRPQRQQPGNVHLSLVRTYVMVYPLFCKLQNPNCFESISLYWCFSPQTRVQNKKPNNHPRDVTLYRILPRVFVLHAQ